jgi:hypothetical protein
MIGTMSFEDIYGAGSLDTLPPGVGGETQGKTNPNNSEVTGSVAKDKAGIMNIKGNILGQPLTAWFGLLVLLFGLKYLVEMKA